MNHFYKLSKKSIINQIFFKYELLFNAFKFVVSFSVKKSRQKRTKQLNLKNNCSSKKKSSKVSVAFIFFIKFYY